MKSKNPAAVALGKIKSAAKSRASKLNGTLGGRPVGSKDSKPRKPAAMRWGKKGKK